MKHNGKFLLGLLALGIVVACTQAPKQVFGKSLHPSTVRSSTVRLITADANKVIPLGGGFSIIHPEGLGSGFFVEHDKIATNIHCIAGVTKISAKLVGRETLYKIRGVTASDPKNDLVILEVVSTGSKPLPLGNSDAVQVDEPIFAVGDPIGGVEGQVTWGKIYNKRDSDGWFRMTTKLSPGNSGGPVSNSKGVIGVAAQTGTSSWQGDISFSYAIPSKTLKELLKNSEPTQSLDRWQKKEQIRAYAYSNQAKYVSQFGQTQPDPDIQHQSYKKEIELLDKAIGLYRHPKFYFSRGVAKAQLEQYQKAIEDYTESITLNSDFAPAYYMRADAKMAYLAKLQYLGDYKGAIADFSKAIELIPVDAMAYHNRGLARFRWGLSKKAWGESSKVVRSLYQAAIDDFDEAIRLNPNLPVALQNHELVKKALEELEK